MKSKRCHLRGLWLLSFFFILLFTQSVLAANSGTIGSCSWKISGGTLTIQPKSGSSCTLPSIEYEFEDEDYNVPWFNRKDVTRIVINKSVKAGTSANHLFHGLSYLTDISGLRNLDVSNVKSMDWMFMGCQSLVNLSGLDNWNVSNVESMWNMFRLCEKLTSLTGVEKWNVSNVTEMSYMFYLCGKLTDLTALKNWNVSKVDSMCCMFYDCISLKELTGLQNWNVSGLTNMNHMFANCRSLTNVTALGNWDVSNVTVMMSTFEGCKSLKNVTALQNWNVTNVADMYRIFWNTNVYCSGEPVYTNTCMSTYQLITKCFPSIKVAGLKAAVSGTTVKLTWNSFSGGKSYDIYRSTSANSGYAKIGTTAGTSYNASGLTRGTTYYFKVRALLTSGKYSSYSSAVSAAIPMLPVSGVKVSVSGTTAKLTWTAFSGRKNYEIYRSTSASAGYKKIGTTTGTSYNASGLTRGTTYYFKVRALLTNGKYSSYSSAVSAAIPMLPVSGVKASVSGTTAKLTWTAFSGRKNYEIYRSTSASSGYKKIGTTTGTSYNASGLTSGTTYYFKVRALLTNGKYSSYSSAVSAAIPLPTPGGLKAVVSGTTAKLTWTALSGGKSYDIYRSTSADSGYEKIGTTTETSYDVSELTIGTTYYFKIIALLTSGNYSYYSAVVTAVVFDDSVQTAALSAPSAVEINEDCSEDGSTCTLSEKVCTEIECTVTSRVCVIVGDQQACAEPVVTVVPVLTETPTVPEVAAVPAMTQKPAAEINEDCSEDGGTCTISEKVCTETECTVTSKICVIVGDQQSCAEPMVTVVPVLTETPAVPEAAAELTVAQAVFAEAETNEDCSEDGSTCTLSRKVCTETECTITSKVCVVIGDQQACAEPIVTVVPVLTETPVTEESTAEPNETETPVTEEPTAEPTETEAPAAEGPTAEPTETEAPAAEGPTEEPTETETPAVEEPTAELTENGAPAAEVPTEELTETEAPAAKEPTAEPTETEAPAAEGPTEEEPAAAEASNMEPVATEDLTIREISIEGLTDDSITFNAPESYRIELEQLKVIPEAADWADLTFNLDDETVVEIKTKDIEIIKAEGLTLNGLRAGSTVLRIHAGNVEKAISLTVGPSAADIQAEKAEAASAVESSEAEGAEN